jgi:membrane protein implicated in regulation of membrane protease activity
MTLGYWLFQPEVWVIAGILLVLAEVLDGSAIFFLPFGLGALANALLVHWQGSAALPSLLVLETWYDTLISLALLALVALLVLRLFMRFRCRTPPADVNDY